MATLLSYVLRINPICFWKSFTGFFVFPTVDTNKIKKLLLLQLEAFVALVAVAILVLPFVHFLSLSLSVCVCR